MNFLKEQEIDFFVQNGFVIVDQWLSEAEVEKILLEVSSLQDQFRKAQITQEQVTKGSEEKLVRGDWTYWLTGHESQNLNLLYREISDWAPRLNEIFYCGLKRLEAHLAYYPPGPGYEAHFDQPRGQGHRLITFVLYLNPNWKPSDGGELSLKIDAETSLMISPTAGKLVLFRSEEFLHEVLPCQSPRRSLTGWFRNDAL